MGYTGHCRRSFKFEAGLPAAALTTLVPLFTTVLNLLLPHQTKHKWYLWGLNACGGPISHADTLGQTTRGNTPPVGIPTSITGECKISQVR